jgi:D-serine deaminase-like pyridoxal phosphate-dependent protein
MTLDISQQTALGVSKKDLDTPCFVVDLDLMERNIEKMAGYFRNRPAGLRPHMKHHKTPEIAHKQIDAGAIGVCCQKLGEAEAMADGGVDNILITYEIIGAAKIRRLVNLAQRVNLLVTVDDAGNVRELSDAAVAAGASLGILVDVNCGQDRCGVDPGRPALELAQAVAQAPGLELRGLCGYEGHLQAVADLEDRTTRAKEAMAMVTETADAIRQAGLPVEIVSSGGTGTYNITGDYPGVTEVQAGSYVLMDAAYRKVLQDFNVAGTILTSVVSRNGPDRAVLDAGMKAISTDQWPPLVVGLPGIEFRGVSDEHLSVTLTDSDSRQLRPGDKVELVPGHNDTTVHLHTHLFGLRRGTLESVWEVAGRGRIR